MQNIKFPFMELMCIPSTKKFIISLAQSSVTKYRNAKWIFKFNLPFKLYNFSCVLGDNTALKCCCLLWMEDFVRFWTCHIACHSLLICCCYFRKIVLSQVQSRGCVFLSLSTSAKSRLLRLNFFLTFNFERFILLPRCFLCIPPKSIADNGKKIMNAASKFT